MHCFMTESIFFRYYPGITMVNPDRNDSRVLDKDITLMYFFYSFGLADTNYANRQRIQWQEIRI